MKLVLAADKDPHSRRLIAEYLQQSGYRVEVVADGLAAMEQLLLLRPALLIAAVMLPKTDGLALCRQVKNDPVLRATPVLICSILAATARAKDAGADAFLSKPLTKERLVRAVEGVLQAAPPQPRTAS